ncbi:MAG: flagellar basal body rod protein FlgB [Acidimicrobiales bacterium]
MIIGGSTVQYLASALRGLDAQREAHEFNIANVETPGFKARQVEFTDALRRAMDTGRVSGDVVTTSTSLEKTRVDGNNVRLDHELLGLEQNALAQQLVTEAVNDQFGLIRTALGR